MNVYIKTIIYYFKKNHVFLNLIFIIKVFISILIYLIYWTKNTSNYELQELVDIFYMERPVWMIKIINLVSRFIKKINTITKYI